MPLSILIQSHSKTIAVPYNKDFTINQLIETILKRSGLTTTKTDQYKLQYKGDELYKDDTLIDLDINDSCQLVLIDELNVTSVNNNNNIVTTNNTDALNNNVELKIEQEEFQKLEINSDDNTFKVKELMMIVLDVSGSMGGKVTGFDSMTRSDVSQTLFQTLLDKFVSFEVPIAAGLVIFGHSIETRFAISRNFDSFSQELGEVVANQSSTRLYESILHAAKEIVNYKSKPLEKLADESQLQCRLFLLTDGEDTSSVQPFGIYEYLKKHRIVLDAIPIGSSNEGIKKLSAFTKATGGSCFMSNNISEAVALFEREALLMPTMREGFSPFEMKIKNSKEFNSITGTTYTTIERKVDTSLKNAKCVLNVDHAKVESSLNTNSGKITGAGGKRIFNEYKSFQNSILSDGPNNSSFTIYLDVDDITIWKVVIKGPVGTPYEGGHFIVSLQFPSDYPFKPPKVRFENKVYHCNINSDGNVCLDILKDSWSPALSAEKVCQSLCSLLSNPNADDPLDVVKAGVYRDDIKKYNNNCTEWVHLYALPLDELLEKHKLN